MTGYVDMIIRIEKDDGTTFTHCIYLPCKQKNPEHGLKTDSY